MRERKIALIACKVLSIYVFVQGIVHISNFITLFLIPLLDQSFIISFKSQIVVMSLVPAFILLILAIVLWLKAEEISKLIITEEDNLDNNRTLNIEELQSIALSIVGIVILVSVIPAFFREIPNMLQLRNEFVPSNSNVRAQIICSIVEKVTRLILGLLLVLKVKGIAGLVRRLQRVGLENIDED